MKQINNILFIILCNLIVVLSLSIAANVTVFYSSFLNKFIRLSDNLDYSEA